MTWFMAWLALMGVAFTLVCLYLIAANINRLHSRITTLERIRGWAMSNEWEAEIKPPGRIRGNIIRFPASDEGDALRQLLAQNIKQRDIASLRMVKPDESPVPQPGKIGR